MPPPQTSQLPPPLPPGPSGPSGPSVAAPGPAAAGLMNLMFADDSQDVSLSRTKPPPKLRSAEEVEVSKPELDTEATAPVSNDALEVPMKLDTGEAKDTLGAVQPEADMADMADTLPGSLNEVGFEPFSVPVAEPVADGPVLQTVSFFDMLKGLD